jgi:hypothetical protein
MMAEQEQASDDAEAKLTASEAREAKLREALRSATVSLGWAETHLKDAGVTSAQVSFGDRHARAALEENKP